MKLRIDLWRTVTFILVFILAFTSHTFSYNRGKRGADRWWKNQSCALPVYIGPPAKGETVKAITTGPVTDSVTLHGSTDTGIVNGPLPGTGWISGNAGNTYTNTAALISERIDLLGRQMKLSSEISDVALDCTRRTQEESVLLKCEQRIKKLVKENDAINRELKLLDKN